MRRSSKDAWYSINLIPKNIILVGPFVQLHSVSFWECFAYEILNQTIDQWLLHFYTKIRTKIIKTHGDLQWDAAVKRRLMEYLLSTFVHKFSKFISDELIKQEMVTSDRRGRWPSLSCTRYSPRAGSMTRPGPCHTSNMTLCDLSLQAIIVRHKTTLSNFKHSYIQSVTFVDLEDCFSR